MTITITDQDLIADLDFPEPCVAIPDCPTPAAWRWICGLCGFVGPACSTHKEALDRMHIYVVRTGGHMLCAGCNQDVKHSFRWEAIGR